MFDENLENLVDQFENRIIPVQDGDIIESIAEKYASVNHPQIGYRVGEKFLIADWKEDALPYLIKSAKFGIDPTNPYLSTGYGDSIGQSMWYILNNFDFKNDFESYEYKIYCSAFIILSITINAMGTDAYNSIKTRALMIDNYDKPARKKMISKYYYDGDDLCTEILSYADYYQAAVGFSKVGQNLNSQSCREWAQENKETMLSLPQYNAMSGMPEQAILKMSQDNQIHLLNNMLEDFKSGAFKLSESEFENAIENYRIKPRRGLFGWK